MKERKDFYKQAQRERYAWAKSVDSASVIEYEKRTNEQRTTTT